jgi:hypothetical protein
MSCFLFPFPLRCDRHEAQSAGLGDALANLIAPSIPDFGAHSRLSKRGVERKRY